MVIDSDRRLSAADPRVATLRAELRSTAPRCHAAGPAVGRIETAGRCAGQRRYRGRRGHPADPHAGRRRSACRSPAGWSACSTRTRRPGCPPCSTTIKAGATVLRGQRRRHAADQRSGLPAGDGVRGGRPAGQLSARPVGGDHRAGRLRAAVGPVLLRGVRAAQAVRAPDLAGRSWPANRAPCVFFESPRRLAECLHDAVDVLGAERRAVVCRELTKIHEEIRARIARRAGRSGPHDGVLGEITVVLAGAQPVADLPTLLAEVRRVGRERYAGQGRLRAGRRRRIPARRRGVSSTTRCCARVPAGRSARLGESTGVETAVGPTMGGPCAGTPATRRPGRSRR